MNLYTGRIDQFTASLRIAEHVFFVRIGNVLLLFLMAGVDALLGSLFDFPAACFLLVLCVILGLDIKTFYKLLRK